MSGGAFWLFASLEFQHDGWMGRHPWKADQSLGRDRRHRCQFARDRPVSQRRKCRGGLLAMPTASRIIPRHGSCCGRSSGVERNLAKVEVVGSNPIARSILSAITALLFDQTVNPGGNGQRDRLVSGAVHMNEVVKYRLAFVSEDVRQIEEVHGLQPDVLADCLIGQCV
jgi:hypothetical protein